MSDPIRIEADAFGTSWLACQFCAGWLYAGTVGPVARTVPVRVVYHGDEGSHLSAVSMAAELRRAGYERVSVEREG